MACASHGGSDGHVRRVREILSAAGRTRGRPRLRPGRAARPGGGDRAARGGRPARRRCATTARASTRSGSRFAAAEGWPVEGYIDKGHPLQDAMERGPRRGDAGRRRASSRAPPTAAGCGRSRCRSRGSPRRSAGSPPAASGPPASGSRRAMTRAPRARRLRRRDRHRADARASAAGCKIGAEGVLGIGLPDGRGAALKVLDGATRALDVVAPLLLEEHWDLGVRQRRARAAARARRC